MAKKRWQRTLFDFLDGGAFNEATIRKNSEDFERIQLKKRIFKDIKSVEMSTDIMGQKIDFPLILAPVGFAGVFAQRGEVQAARAAAKAQVPFSLSAVSICSTEEVSKNSPEPFWFQFFMFKDRGYSLGLLQRAQSAKCPVLLLTADLPVAGACYRYHRSRKQTFLKKFLQNIFHPRWWVDVRLKRRPLTIGNLPSHAPALPDLSSMRTWMGNQFNQSFSWKNLEWVHSHWKGKILIKGILDQEDALMAQALGADGIVVSNHGGRHLDSTLSSIAALPSICDAVGDRLKVLVDGGISSSLDILKSLAIGAHACMIGKPWAFGLEARGEKGVTDVLTILKKELSIVMTHLGVSSVKEINRNFILRS